MDSKRNWISEHPRVVIGFILVICLGPFLNKAVHTDDALYVWTGQWIQHHPTDCFGLKVNEWYSEIPIWKANWNPPLMSYYLAGVASLFGWSEVVLHLAGLAVAFMATMGIYALAQRWCGRPLLAALVAIFTPAFLVSSTTLMCDVLMLTFWIWALVVWDRALANEQSRWQFVGAGVLAGLSVLTKYSAVTLLPLLPILGILRTRKFGWWLLGLAPPLIMVAGYEWMTTKMYGIGLFSNAVAHIHHSREFPGSWEARGIIGLAFAGGCLLPLLFFAPFLWRPRILIAGGVVIFGLWVAMFLLWNDLGLINRDSADPKIMKQWYYLLQVALLTAVGLLWLYLTLEEAWHEQEANAAILVLWIISGLFSAMVLNFAVNARSFLLIVPPAAILLVRRLEAAQGNLINDGWLLWPLIPTTAVTLSVIIADYQLANSARTAAEQITSKYRPTGRQLWFEGHGAFQYYMEKSGGRPIDVEQSLLRPGDVVVVPWIGNRVSLPAGSVGWVQGLTFRPFSWMNLMGGPKGEAAGFYGANLGPIPFAIGRLPDQDYFVVKVFSVVQFDAWPANPREVAAGDVPSFPNISFTVDDPTTFPWKPEAIKQEQLASQHEADGNLEAAIHYHREALIVDSNNPAVLNNLAWILATARKSELRNGGEAVRLATRAVAVTDRRVPRFIRTLAAAYAESGQYATAMQIAQTARILAMLASQPDEAAQIDRWLSLHSSGKPVEATNSP